MQGLPAKTPIETGWGIARGVISLSFVCFQAEYQNYSVLKEPIIQEIEESTVKGVLVRSARRFVEDLASSRATYAR